METKNPLIGLFDDIFGDKNPFNKKFPKGSPDCPDCKGNGYIDIKQGNFVVTRQCRCTKIPVMVKDIESAMYEHKDNQVSSLLNHIDKGTANIFMSALSKKYGFKTVEVEGWVVTSTGWVSVLFMVDSNSINHIIRKYNLWNKPLSRLQNSICKPIKEILELSENDFSSKLINYPTILALAIRGRSEKAEEIKQYLLNTEKQHRLEMGAQVVTGKTVAELQGKPLNRPTPEPLEESVETMMFEDYGILQVHNFNPYGKVLIVKQVEKLCGCGRGSITVKLRKIPEIGFSFKILTDDELKRFKKLRICYGFTAYYNTNSLEIVSIQAARMISYWGKPTKRTIAFARFLDSYEAGHLPVVEFRQPLNSLRPQLAA